MSLLSVALTLTEEDIKTFRCYEPTKFYSRVRTNHKTAILLAVQSYREGLVPNLPNKEKVKQM